MAKVDFNKAEDDIVEFFDESIKRFNLPVDLKFYTMTNTKQKQLVKIAKISDPYSVALNCDVLVTVNDGYFDSFDEEAKNILFDQEIDKIEWNLEKGTFKITKANFSTNRGIIEKYTYEKVARAVELEKTMAKGEEKE
jgi:hypothetical protein